MHIVKSKTRLIAAAFFFVLCCIFFFMYPELSRHDGAPAASRIALPAFCLFSLLLTVFEKKESGKFLSFALSALLLAVAASALLYATDILGGGDFWRIAAGKPYAALYGAAAALGVWLFFYAITAGAALALVFTTVVFALFGFASYFVDLFRNQPFLPMDLSGARTALSVLPAYTFGLSAKAAEAILIFAGVILIALRRWPRLLNSGDQRKARLGTLILAVAFFGITTTEWHMKRFDLEPQFFDQRKSIDANGALVNFLGNIPGSRLRAPAGYSLEAVDDVAENFISDPAISTPATAIAEMPDVIVVMGESWSDLTPKGIVETNEPVTPFLDSFRGRKDAHHGKLRVSVKGGQTSCSEFEFFAGTNLQFGMHVAPLMIHVNGPTPAMPAFFKQMGYRTVAMHNGDKRAWGRDRALPLIGFDRFYSAPDMEYPEIGRLRYYLSDRALYRKALSELEKDDGPPLFLYLITIQTHGGYHTENYDSSIKIIKPEGPYPQAEQYLGLMRQSDRDFAEFMRAVEKRKRPTIVLAYGDHLPAVEWQYWAKVLTPSEQESWEFTTFYVVWSNFSAPVEQLAAFPALSLNYLGAHFMKIAGLPSTGHQKFIRDCSTMLPALTPRGAIDGFGNFIPIDQAAGLTAFREQAIMQYNLLKGGDDQKRDFFYLQPPPKQ